jgi:hypothetical protein
VAQAAADVSLLRDDDKADHWGMGW